jgi:hypothetical protein
MGRNRRGAWSCNHCRHRLGHLDVEIGGAHVDAVFAGLEQHVGEDRVSVAALDDAVHMAEGFEQVVALEGDFHSFLSLPVCCSPGSKNPGAPGLGPWQFSQ